MGFPPEAPMFSQEPDKQISSLGECALIERIHHALADVCPPAPAGIGDDCAVLPPSTAHTLATTDGLILGKHFLEDTPPELVGRKLMNRNLSDIAAMGGTPRHALLALILPPTLATDWLDAFIAGITQAAQLAKCEINGGDIAEGNPDQFAAHITLLGASNRPILRSTARAGDRLYVTGTLGGSLKEKHLTFTPRLAEGQWLAQRPEITAMIDLSDGLAKDLPAILPKSTAARLHLAKLPCSADAHTTANETGKPATHHALCDGEDYELLLTLDPRNDLTNLESDWADTFDTPLTCIGEITDSHDPDNQLLDSETNQPIKKLAGYTHLKS